jgi:hypothetical protein
MLKESYENMKLVLRCMRYNIYCWNIHGYFEVIALIFGTQFFAASYMNGTMPPHILVYIQV